MGTRLLVVAVALAACVAVVAAPRGTPKADPAPDHVAGPLETRCDSPVVRVSDEADGVVWLVWRNPVAEAEQLRDLPADGRRVVARGKLGTGGKYRYLIVARIAPDE